MSTQSIIRDRTSSTETILEILLNINLKMILLNHQNNILFKIQTTLLDIKEQ